MKKSLLYIITISVFFISQPITALTNRQAHAWTNGLALTTAALTYVLTPSHPDYISVGISAATFVVANRFFNWIFSRYTPLKRYQWAQDELVTLEKQYLFNQEITQDTLAEVLQESGCETSEISLVTAFLVIQSFDKQLTYIIDELNRGTHDAGYSSLSTQIHDLVIEAQKHLKRIRANETILKAQPQWVNQWNVILEREKMAHMQTHVVLHIGNQ